MKSQIGCAAVMAVLTWILWVNVQEAAKPLAWETKGSFDNAAQCRNAVDIELERIKEKERSKIEITKGYEFGASLTFKSDKKSKKT